MLITWAIVFFLVSLLGAYGDKEQLVTIGVIVSMIFYVADVICDKIDAIEKKKEN